MNINQRLRDIIEQTKACENTLENSEIAVTTPDLSFDASELDIFEELEVEYREDLERIFG